MGNGYYSRLYGLHYNNSNGNIFIFEEFFNLKKNFIVSNYHMTYIFLLNDEKADFLRILLIVIIK